MSNDYERSLKIFLAICKMVYRHRYGRVGGFASAAKKLIASRPVKRRGRPRKWIDVPTPALSSAVKKVINRQEETKFVSVDPVDVDMGARRWYVMQPIANIAKGTADNQRVGSEVKNLYMKMAFTWMARVMIPLVLLAFAPVCLCV